MYQYFFDQSPVNEFLYTPDHVPRTEDEYTGERNRLIGLLHQFQCRSRFEEAVDAE